MKLDPFIEAEEAAGCSHSCSGIGMNVPLLMCFRASRAATSNVPSEFGVNETRKSSNECRAIWTHDPVRRPALPGL